MGKRRKGRGGKREGAGRPLKARLPPAASQEGLAGAWTRATIIVKKAHLRKLKALALRRGQRLKEVLDGILEGAL